MSCSIYSCLVLCGQSLFPARVLCHLQYEHLALKGQLICFSGIILEKTGKQSDILGTNYSKIYLVSYNSYSMFNMKYSNMEW